uniref:Major capsid protein n=1 Tax=Myoviridae sp. ctBvM24 TaxID=2825050 RepID=A0A8S5UCZ8_9CAUD|nr:MAG TPA: major capsid protein [Myoviridae sp. ctBvM24]
MNEELRKLLKKINDKKNEVKSLVNEGKIKEAKEAKVELVEMQDKFNILMDLDDDEKEGIKDQVDKGTTKNADGRDSAPSKKDIARAFVNRIVCGMRKTKMKEEDRKIMDAMSENSDEDGGFTVPKDVQTDINELRRTDDDLEQYVNTEPVTTLTGSRVYEVDADSTPWDDVEEGEEFGEEETPKLRKIEYKIKKKGGILKVTRELLKDSAENILGFLNKWIAKKSRATRNAAILKKLAEITTGKEVAIEDYDDLKGTFNVTLDPAIAASSIVLTNQSGFNYLDKLKDERGDYILQHDVTDKSKMLLFGVYPIKKISNKVLKNEPVKKGGTGSDKDDIVAYKYPVYMGDLKEAITLFDREKISIELSTEAGDLWAKDKTGIKVRDRFDVQAFDEKAVVKGIITEQVAG